MKIFILCAFLLATLKGIYTNEYRDVTDHDIFDTISFNGSRRRMQILLNEYFLNGNESIPNNFLLTRIEPNRTIYYNISITLSHRPRAESYFETFTEMFPQTRIPLTMKTVNIRGEFRIKEKFALPEISGNFTIALTDPIYVSNYNGSYDFLEKHTFQITPKNALRYEDIISSMSQSHTFRQEFRETLKTKSHQYATLFPYLPYVHERRLKKNRIVKKVFKWRLFAQNTGLGRLLGIGPISIKGLNILTNTTIHLFQDKYHGRKRIGYNVTVTTGALEGHYEWVDLTVPKKIKRGACLFDTDRLTMSIYSKSGCYEDSDNCSDDADLDSRVVVIFSEIRSHLTAGACAYIIENFVASEISARLRAELERYFVNYLSFRYILFGLDPEK